MSSRQQHDVVRHAQVKMRLKYVGDDVKVPVVLLAGELDIETVPEVDRFLRQVFGPFYFKQHILLDLEGVTLIDSSFVSYIVRLVRRLHGEGKELVLTRPVGYVRRVLSLVGLPNLVPVYESMEEAAALMRGGKVPSIPPAFPPAAVT